MGLNDIILDHLFLLRVHWCTVKEVTSGVSFLVCWLLHRIFAWACLHNPVIVCLCNLVEVRSSAYIRRVLQLEPYRTFSKLVFPLDVDGCSRFSINLVDAVDAYFLDIFILVPVSSHNEENASTCEQRCGHTRHNQDDYVIILCTIIVRYLRIIGQEALLLYLLQLCYIPCTLL